MIADVCCRSTSGSFPEFAWLFQALILVLGAGVLWLPTRRLHDLAEGDGSTTLLRNKVTAPQSDDDDVDEPVTVVTDEMQLLVDGGADDERQRDRRRSGSVQ